MHAGTSPVSDHTQKEAHDNNSKAKCRNKLSWAQPKVDSHSYSSVTDRTRQRDVQKMMKAIDSALGSKAGTDRQLAAVLICADKLQKTLGTEDQELLATMLCPQIHGYIENTKETFGRLNESSSNASRAAKIAIASCMLNESSNKSLATRFLGVSRRTINQAILHNKAFKNAATAHEAATALQPTPR